MSAGSEARAASPRVAPRDALERLLWTLMRKFEALALARYSAHVPLLATAAKRRFVERLREVAPDDALLAASELAAPTDALFATAERTEPGATVLVQGIVLELLGQAIYRTAEETAGVSPDARALATAGRAASEEVSALAARWAAEHVGTGETLYAVFADVSHDALAALDAVGEPVDRIFGERFGLRFADVVGEFAADLIGICVELGIQRRKVVAHLAAACMGL